MEHSTISDDIPSGLLSLAIVLHILKVPVNLQQLKHEYCVLNKDLDDISLVKAARSACCKCRQVKVGTQDIRRIPTPFIAKSADGKYFVVGKVEDEKALIQVPGSPPAAIDLMQLFGMWTGDLFLIKEKAKIISEPSKFSISWFLNSIKKYKGVLVEVLVASLFIQTVGLMMPILFQVVMDKVLVHHSMSTLNVIAFALVGISIFEVLLNGFRNYLFSHTTSKVDVLLGAKLFHHLLRLPISYFTARAAGQIVARVRELETVRSFLTGQALTAVLDAVFSIIFIAVMFAYSPYLTWVVIASIPLYIAISVILTPAIRVRTEEKFQKGAASQSYLTETVVGIETLKSIAVEPIIKNRWELKLADYVASSFKVVVLTNIGSQLIALVSKLVTAALLWLGAQAVIDGDMTIGALIAFNMLSGQVSQPILRLSQLWQDFQQFKISLDRLGDLLNFPTEVENTSGKHPESDIKGQIKFQNVVFRYEPGKPEVLRNVNFEINAGQVIGIVGTSGSGKSTVTKLMQRLYIPELGKVTIDSLDISTLDPAWLRRQVGVVLQENILFDMSIRDNISLSDPAMSFARVVRAAKLAGAHDFIMQLPDGYDTHLKERGTGLSGGQKQRIAIARALAMDPKILILDEATSALDYESESEIQKNMKEICQGRTVIIIAHRLSSVRNADKIITMESGSIVEEGSHDELMENTSGRYYRLNIIQSSGGINV